MGERGQGTDWREYHIKGKKDDTLNNCILGEAGTLKL